MRLWWMVAVVVTLGGVACVGSDDEGASEATTTRPGTVTTSTAATTAPAAQTTTSLGTLSSVTTARVTTTLPEDRGPFLVAWYLEDQGATSYVEVLPVSEDEVDVPLVLAGVHRLESDGAGGVIFSRFRDPAVWHWASGVSEPRLIAEVERGWAVGFIADEPHLVVTADEWKESYFGWCDGDPCFGGEGFLAGSGDRVVRLIRVSDGVATFEHTEPFVLSDTEAQDLLAHHFVAGGDSLAFVRSQIPDTDLSPYPCEEVEFRSMTGDIATVPMNPFSEVSCALWGADVGLLGLSRDGALLVYEEEVDESLERHRDLVALDLNDGTEAIRITMRPEEHRVVYGVDFDPSGAVILFWVDTETEESYTEVVDLDGDTVRMPWPVLDGTKGIPTVSYLPAVYIDLTQLTESS